MPMGDEGSVGPERARLVGQTDSKQPIDWLACNGRLTSAEIRKLRNELRPRIQAAERLNLYDQSLILLMKRARIARPHFITKKDWNMFALPVNAESRVICYLSAWGLDPGKISNETGFSKTDVLRFLSQPQAQTEIAKIQRDVFGDTPKKWIEKILPEAIGVAYNLMMDPKVRSQTRLEAARDFMDRSMGKATLKIENDNPILRRVFEQLDELAKDPQRKLLPAGMAGPEPEKEAPISQQDSGPAEDLDDDDSEREMNGIEQRELKDELDQFVDKFCGEKP